MSYDLPSSEKAWNEAQPYAMWERARSECPVIQLDPMGPDSPPIHFVTRYDDAVHVLRDWETFSSSVNTDVMGAYMGELILGLNGEEHRQYRSLVAHTFRASVLERWDQELVRPLINSLLDQIVRIGRANLVADITAQYPVQVICGIVGVPLDDHMQFAAWADDINGGPMHHDRGVAASQAMRAYLEPLVAARRVEPTGDLLSELVLAEIDGERLSDERLYGFLRLLLPAGAETTFRVMGNTLFALLNDSDALAAVTADRDLLPVAIEETLRWETSVTMVSRVATRDTEIAGCPIPSGSSVNVLTGSADRDASRFGDPNTWSIDRPQTPHLAFGTGPHQCLGMHLARLELRSGLDAILTRLPNLRLDPDAEVPIIEGFAFRGPNALPVLFDAS